VGRRAHPVQSTGQRASLPACRANGKVRRLLTRMVMADLRESPHATATRHPWETARLRFFARALADAGVLTTARRVLDVGAGDAFLARSLLPRLSPEAEIHCVDTGYPLEPPSDPQLPTGLHLHHDLPPGQFDLILLLDILEHVEDDAGFLRNLLDRLQPNGRVLLSVPAWQPLYTRHDTALLHHRRYAPQQARAVLASAGLRVLMSGGLFHALLLPRVVTRLTEGLRPPATAQPTALAWNHGRLVTGAVQAVLAADNALSRWGARTGADLPGLSWWALCCK
jgi:2-polyprenyl-3-methyl-5-hydroxy-6-metoxy-1,4-benzoquinol methylase